jgi:hypothetical protein
MKVPTRKLPAGILGYNDETQVLKTCTLADIWTQHLQDTVWESYRYTDLSESHIPVVA